MKWSVKSSVLRYQTAVIGYCLFLILCAITLLSGKAESAFLKWILVLMEIWSLFRLFFCISRVRKPVEVLSVDREGLKDRTSIWSLNEIPWTMVEEIKMMPRGKQTVICLYGSELKQLVSKKFFLLQPVIHLNHLLGYGYHCIYPLYADVDLDLLYSVIKRKGK